ncbi:MULTISPECIES: hypothetical protein [unclassified Anabaena]|uniref:hypothetical protein n=1 Tax=unclassified Anabaena TaxID=2619674 RepID=UPI0014474202|nr:MULTISPECIES: hypothetical protein [unclassified Anabaena]MTJ08763.1 hypothetical protein [Anabaena sp. UHCC 0204]MTJ53073.1 hypothetical protein [Anabaena sp. UHCC 0253]
MEKLLKSLGLVKRVAVYLLRRLKLKKSFSKSDLQVPLDFEVQNSVQPFTRQWFEQLYSEVGDGNPCYRPLNTPDYDGGVLKGCTCCSANTQLHLLPNEEKMFVDAINDWDFRLTDNEDLLGRKTIYCSKMGLCNGHKPFICRTHPVYFSEGAILFVEGQCRLTAYKFFQFQHEQIEKIRSIVYKYGLEKVILGYAKKAVLDDGKEVVVDYHC